MTAVVVPITSSAPSESRVKCFFMRKMKEKRVGEANE